MDGSVVEGLDELPIQDIRENLLDLFSDWKLDNDMDLLFEKDEEAFQVTFDPYYVRFDCYGRTISYRNKLIRLSSLSSLFAVIDKQFDF